MRKIGCYGENVEFNDENIDGGSCFYIKETDIAKIIYIENKDGEFEIPKVADSEDLNRWAIILNSPWSQADERYIIEFNCKDAYTQMDEKEPKYRCIYTVVGYELITGYGNTEEEALKDCKDLFKYLQENFNPEDKSF